MSGQSIGPAIPAHLLKGKQPEVDDESSDDDYGPALPPDLASTSNTTKRVIGPSFPTGRPTVNPDDSDDDYGPKPLPPGHNQEEDGVSNFLEREERRQKAIEEDSKPKALKRDEWMLKPPEASNIFSSLDTTKLKARQFSRKTEDKITDQTLWTETPAERQQRLADEVTGKRKRVEAAAGGNATVEESLEDRKRRRRDQEIQDQVQEYTKKNRGQTLLDMHSKAAPSKDSKDSAPAAIWDRDRDMSFTGRLMDEKSRSKLVKDAKDLGSRFGRGTSGGFL
ncbi:hypothetical protein FRB94_010598 [Tulasnella sp. JGI-2019a]|nr:hypothetical protein FRB94_010598 [Tulasnella sp. JGI-2019a]